MKNEYLNITTKKRFLAAGKISFSFFFFWKIVSVAKGTNSVVIGRLQDYDPTKGPFSVAKIYFFMVNYITLIFKC